MLFYIAKLVLPALLIMWSHVVFSQAEMTSVYNEFVKINENAKKIKDAKIKKSTSIITTKESTDTLNISYYDINGNLINEMNTVIVSSSVESKKIYQKSAYKYDEHFRVLEKFDSTGGEVRRKVLHYEADGTLTAEEIYNSKGDLIKELSHEYDDLSRLIETIEMDNVAKCRTDKKYAYDSYNNMAKYVLSSNCNDSASRSLNITYVYKYDNKSNIIEKNTYFSSKNFKTESFTYGSNGKLYQSYIITGPEIYTLSLYSYDNSNFLTKIDKTEVNGSEKTKYLVFYKNDKFGNVLEIRELTVTGVQSYVLRYEYEYY